MSKTIEEILRAARKANGETFGAPPKPISPPPKPIKYDEPKKWHEKKWGVALALIVCFPIGLILLWQNPRYTNGIKGVITVAILFLILNNPLAADKPVSHDTKSVYTQNNRYNNAGNQLMSYQGSNGDTGYLRQDAEWLDGNGDFHYNSKKVKVEIGKQKVVASDGRLTQIYFLEGKYCGVWGYTSEYNISR